MEVEISLQRKSKTYVEGENVIGIVHITCKGIGDTKHDGIVISLDGTVAIANNVLSKNKLRW